MYHAAPSRWRSRTRLAVTLLLTPALFAAGCGGDVGSSGSSAPSSNVACDVAAPKAKTKINLLAYASPSIDPFSQAMASGCSKVNNLEVNHSPVDFSAQLSKAQLSLPAKNASYDIVEVYNNTLNQYAAAGQIVPLDDLFAKYKEKYDLADIDAPFLESFKYKGKLYGLPMLINVHEMVYRKDIFAELGIEPPKTFGEIIAACKVIEKSEKVRQCFGVPLSADVYITSAFNNALTSLGGTWANLETSRPELDSPQAKAAVEALKGLLPHMGKNALAADEASIGTQVKNGQTAMAVMYSSTSASTIDDPEMSKFAGKYGFAPAPSVEPGGKPYATLFVDGFSLAKNSKVDPELLFQVAGVGTGVAASKAAGPLAYPTRNSVLADKQLAKRATHWPAATQTIANGAVSPPPQPFLSDLQAAVRPQIAAAVAGKMSVDEALRKAQADAVAFMEKGGFLK